MLVYANGNWVKEEEAMVPLNDQGFLFGDSLFETVRVNQGQPFRVQKHLERMKRGMDIIRLEAEPQLDVIPQLLDTYIRKNDLDSALVRIMITRGVAPGSAGEHPTGPALFIKSRSLPQIPEAPVPIIFLEEKNYPLLRFYPAIKSGNYLGNMLAKKDAEAAGAFEPVFVNDDGYVTECAIRNIFFVSGNTLITPHEDLGVLPGVIRDTIMILARQLGMDVEEARVTRAEVQTMDEAFISSTGVAVLPVEWEGFTSQYTKSYHIQSALAELFKSGARDVQKIQS